MSEQVSTYIAPQTLTSAVKQAAPDTQSIPATIVQPINIQALQNLTRPITVNAQILSFDLTGSTSLQTNMGTIDIILSPSNNDFFKALNNLVETSFKEGQKPLFELIIQSGKPAKEAFLIVPTPEKLIEQAQTKTQQALFDQKAEVPFFKKGQTISLQALPKDVDEAALTQKSVSPEQASLGHKAAEVKNKKSILPEKLTQAFSVVKEKGENLIRQVDPRQNVKATQQPQATGQEKAPHLTAGTKIQIDQIIPPKSDSSPLLKPEQVKAEVVGKTLSGQTIIKNEGQSFVVPNKGTLATGTKIIATPLDPYKGQNLPAKSPIDQTMLTGMQDLIASLHQASPKAAQSFVTSSIPSPQNNMSGALLFLFSAIQGNKIEEWIGTSRLAVLAPNVRKRVSDGLSQNLQDKGLVVSDDHVGDWRSWSIPLMNEHAMDALRFYVRQDKENETQKSEKDEPTQYTRFVISMSLSKLGHMQLDGLSQIGRLDLIVRSEKTLPKDLLYSLQKTGHSIYETTGLKGSIQFQENAKNWMSFKEEGTEYLGVKV